MTEETPRERFVAALSKRKGTRRDHTKQTLKEIVVENLDKIVRAHDEDDIDYGDIAIDLANSYGRKINERSFRTTVSLLRNKGTASKAKSAVVRAGPVLPQYAAPIEPTVKPSSSVEAIRDDNPDL